MKPAIPFEAYSHVVSPISAADGGGFIFTIPGVIADGAAEPEAIADGREAFISTLSALVDMGQEDLQCAKATGLRKHVVA